MNYATFKLLANLVVSTSVGKVVGDILTLHLPPALNTSTKVQYAVGKFAIGGLISAPAWRKTEEQIEEIAPHVRSWYSDFKSN